MADRDLLTIVWGETSGLKPKDGNEATLARLHAVVAKLATNAKRRGLDGQLHKQAEPRAEDPDFGAYAVMRSTVNAVDAGTWHSDTELPARAALWEITESGLPPRDRQPPETAAWILDDDIKRGGDFVAGAGADTRTFRLFESAKVPPEDELPYVSSLSGSGTPAPVVTRRWYRNSNWWIGLGGGALFFLTAFNLVWTANSFSEAYNLLTNRQPSQITDFANGLKLRPCPPNASDSIKAWCETPDESLTASNGSPKQGAELEAAKQARDAKRLTVATVIAPDCVSHLTAWAKAERDAGRSNPPTNVRRQGDDREKDLDCLVVVGQAVPYAAKYLVIQTSTTLGHWVRNALWLLFSWQAPSSGLVNVSLGMPTALMMIGVVLVLVGLGRGVTGTPLGVLLSPERRYSLALAQVTFWTVLVLTSVVAIAIFNAGLVAERMRYLAPPISDGTQPTAAINGFFPVIPDGIWAVLGISLSSTLISTWLKRLKGTVPQDAAQLVVKDLAQDEKKVGFLKLPTVTRPDARAASIADWFLGEDAGYTNTIDISRVQMVLVTAGLLVTYGHAIFASIRDLSPQEILLTIQNLDVLIASLPVVGATMAIMLAASHATYLGSKAAGTTGQQASGAGQDSTGRRS